MKFLFVFLLLAGCSTQSPMLGVKGSSTLITPCETQREIRYDAFLGGCDESPCVKCIDTTRAYEELHFGEPPKVIKSPYKELR